MTGALTVDRVIGVTSINLDELRPPTADISTRVATYLVGVQQFQGRLLAILNLEQLLVSKEVRQFELQ